MRMKVKYLSNFTDLRKNNYLMTSFASTLPRTDRDHPFLYFFALMLVLAFCGKAQFIIHIHPELKLELNEG